DDEVAVMDLLAEVAAVHDATVVALHEAVLGPLPHEAAGEAGIRLEEIPVLPHAAGARAHGVHELALDERQRRPPRVVARGTERRTAETLLADLPYLFVARVHARVDVGEAALPVALVVHEAARVEALRPQRHLVEVRARARLVAERPHDHARVVLVAVHGAGHAVEIGVAPARIVTRVVLPADVNEGVGL